MCPVRTRLSELLSHPAFLERRKSRVFSSTLGGLTCKRIPGNCPSVVACSALSRAAPKSPVTGCGWFRGATSDYTASASNLRHIAGSALAALPFEDQKDSNQATPTTAIIKPRTRCPLPLRRRRGRSAADFDSANRCDADQSYSPPSLGRTLSFRVT